MILEGVFTRAVLDRSIALAPPDPLGPVPQNPDDVRAVACKLVAADNVCTPEIATPPRPPAVGGANGLGALVDLVSWILFMSLVMLLVVFLVRAVMHRSRKGRHRARVDHEEVDDTSVVRHGRSQIEAERTPVEWRQEADEHRSGGRYRDSLRCRYRAIVGDLARRDLIDEIPGRTTGEERAQWADRFPGDRFRHERGAFDAVADLFDNAWYGCLSVDDDDVTAMIELEAEVLQATPGAARSVPRGAP